MRLLVAKEVVFSTVIVYQMETMNKEEQFYFTEIILSGLQSQFFSFSGKIKPNLLYKISASKFKPVYCRCKITKKIRSYQ